MISKQFLKDFHAQYATVYASGAFVNGEFKLIDVFIDRESAIGSLPLCSLVDESPVSDHFRVLRVVVEAKYLPFYINHPTYMGYLSLLLAADLVSVSYFISQS